MFVLESLTYIGRKEWVAQPSLDSLDELTLPVKNVVITETDTDTCKDRGDCVKRTRYIQLLNIETFNHCDIDYNFLVAFNGDVFIGRGWDFIGSHTKGCDENSICIALIGSFSFSDREPEQKQMNAVKTLIKVGNILGKIDANYSLYGQSQVSNMSAIKLPSTKVYNIIKTWPHWKNNSDYSIIEYSNNTESKFCEKN